MGIGAGIALLIVGSDPGDGAVDVPDPVNNVIATDTVGWICLVVGALRLALSQSSSPSSARGDAGRRGSGRYDA